MKYFYVIIMCALLFGCSSPAVSVQKTLTVDNFITELNSNGLTVTEKSTTSAGTIGASEAYRFKVNDKFIDYCVFDEGSEKFKIIKSTGNVHIEFGEMKIDKKAVIKNNVVLMLDEHPEKEKIIKILNKF